jgi:CubicO group peptidase (beta-lactamase class C family)
MRCFLSLSGFLFLAISGAIGQINCQPAILDQVLKLDEIHNTPGFSVSIIHNGNIIYEASSGYANLKKQIRISPETVFNACDIAKQFTAMSILILKEQGKLALTDPITQYLPDLPKLRTNITINHLLSHQSGIRDYLDLLLIKKKYKPKYFTKKQFWEDLNQQNQLGFYPGDGFAYINSGYVLLAEIVENVSRESLKDFARKNIFEPLGMLNTKFCNENSKRHPESTYSYKWIKKKNRYSKAQSTSELIGDGQLWTTLNDLYKWDQNFYHNQLGNGNSKLIADLQAEYYLNNGRKSFYSKGLQMNDFNGILSFEHFGYWDYFSSFYIRMPSINLSIVVCSNSDKYRAKLIAKKLQTELLSEITEPEKSQLQRDTGISLQQFEGIFIDLHTKSNIQKFIELEDNLYCISLVKARQYDVQLYNPQKLQPNQIQFGTKNDGDIVFRTDQSENLTHYQWRKSPTIFVKLKADTSNSNVGCTWCGNYFSEELRKKIRIRPISKSPHLQLKTGWFQKRKLEKLEGNYFWNSSEAMVIEFTNESLFINKKRANNIRFERMK